MYKYIGTERQLLDLGFKKLNNDDFETSEKISKISEIQVWYDDKCVKVSHTCASAVDFSILKLFVEMVERGLIVWEE